MPVARRDVDWLFEQNTENWQWQNKKSAVRKFAVLSDSIGECRNGSCCCSIFTFDISEQTLRKSLQEVELVGRFQAIKTDKREKLADYLGVPVETLPTIIVDVGHNPHAAKNIYLKN